MARNNQKLINFHGTQKTALENAKANLNIGEIAVLHGSVDNAALAIKISGGTADDGKLVYFSPSDSVDARFTSAFTAIDKEVADRGEGDDKIQKQIGEGYSSTHTVASAMSLAETAISNLEYSASTYYNNALQNISATAGTFVTVTVGEKTGTPNQGVQGLTIGVTTGTVSADQSALADAKDVKSYVDEKVGAVDEKLGDAFTSAHTVQDVVGTGFTDSTLTKEISDLKALTGDTESALQAISASTTTVDALGNVQISVSEKKGTAGKYYQEIGVSVTTGSTSEENKPGLATASDVYSSIATAKTTLVGKDGDVASANTIFGAKKYAEDKIAAVKIGVTGDSYVTATTTGHNITIETKAATVISSVTETGKVADAKAVKDYVESVKTALETDYDGKDKALDDKITAINNTIGNGFSKDNTIATSVDNIKGRIDKLEEISAATKSALQKVEVSPATDDSKYITFNNSVSGTTGKVVADIIIGSVDKGGSGDGLADAAEVRAKFNTVEGNLSGVSTKVETLIGSDSGKTVREIANAELAAQLIPEGAKESLNTLQEIAAWIQSHPDDAAAMNNKIQTIAGVAFGGFDESGNTKTDGLSAVVATLRSDLDDETTNRTNADTEIKKTIGNGFDSANTVADRVDALDTRIDTLEGLTDKTNSAAQGVSGKTETTDTLEVKTSRDNNNVTITVNTKTGVVAETADTLVTGRAVYTAVSEAETRATNKANEKVATVVLNTFTGAATSSQSGAKVLVGSGNDKSVTLDLSELVIDCGEF